MTSSIPTRGTVVVIGASSGIGLASARCFARRGHPVALCARRLDRLQPEADALDGQSHRAIAIPVDVGKPLSVDGAIAEIHERLGPVDILINAAATIEPAGCVGDIDPESWSRSIAVSLVGVYAVMHALLPSMKQRGHGSIVNISSNAARVPMTGFSAYCSAKAGLEQLTRVAAEEYRPAGIRINILLPGMVDTPMQARARALPPEIVGQRNHDAFQHWFRTGQLRSPEQVARAVYWLASDGSAPATGIVADVDDPLFWAKVESAVPVLPDPETAGE